MLILAVDAATYVGTVAVLNDQDLLAERSVAMRGERAERLMPAIADALAAAGVQPDELDAVACGGGPGSFTSLRIAASIAKGMASALHVPLLVAPSPVLIAAGSEPPLSPARYVAVLDAMRGEVFAHEIEVRGDRSLAPGETWRSTLSEATARSTSAGATLIGPAEVPSRGPHARGFAMLIGAGLATRVDVSIWEPDYGRKAEAQVRWEEAHGRELGDG